MQRMLSTLLLVAGLALAAGDPAGFAVFKASDLSGLQQQLLQKLGPQKSASQQLQDFGTHLMMLSHMEGDGLAEIHEDVNDIFVVREGEGTVTVGGKVIGAKTTAPGEVRGTSIEGGVTHKIAAGDVVNIPPNTPHRTRVAPGQKLTYFVIKVRAK